MSGWEGGNGGVVGGGGEGGSGGGGAEEEEEAAVVGVYQLGLSNLQQAHLRRQRGGLDSAPCLIPEIAQRRYAISSTPLPLPFSPPSLLPPTPSGEHCSVIAPSTYVPLSLPLKQRANRCREQLAVPTERLQSGD